MADWMIEGERVEKRYGPIRALAGVDLVAERGKVLALLGPNGAGKTTLVRILATLLRPDAGRARVAGDDVVADAGEGVWSGACRTLPRRPGRSSGPRRSPSRSPGRPSCNCATPACSTSMTRRCAGCPNCAVRSAAWPRSRQ